MARSSFAFAVIVTALLATVSGQTYPRVQASNLLYLGNFKVPNNIHVGSADSGFEYGGTALAFNPTNSSLFMVGHDWDQLTGELRIPAIGGTATLIQGLADSLSGRGGAVGSGTWKLGGNLVYNGKLHATSFLFYDAGDTQTASHFSRPLTLTSGTVSGPTRAGSLGAGFYSGYMGLVPTEWQAKFGGPAITGNCCLSIISRTSYGPAAFAFDPDRLGTASPLVYYDSNHQTLGRYGASGSNPTFNGTTRVRGVVVPKGTSSVLFFGSTGIGNYCYGEASECGGDPSNGSKGDHAYPYRAYVWAYDANDLAAVKAGSRQPWEVVPYATWELPLGNLNSDGISGAAYDAATGRIYLSQKFAEDARPLVHVYAITNSTTTITAPQAPGNVRIISQ